MSEINDNLMLEDDAKKNVGVTSATLLMMDADESADTTTLPTDVSTSHEEITSQFSTELHNCNNSKTSKKCSKINCNFSSSKISKNEFCNNELQNNFIMKMQISNKEMQLEKLKMEYLQKIDDLELKFGKAIRENEMLKMQLNLERDESKKIKKEFEAKLVNIESKQSKLTTVSSNVQRLLARSSPLLTEDQYELLTKNPQHDISILDYISIKVYEREKDYLTQINKLRMKLQHKNEDIHLYKMAQERLADELDNEKHLRIECEMKLDRSKKLNEELKTKIEHDNFKIDNYNKLFREKEQFELKFLETSKQLDALLANQTRQSQSMEENVNELMTMKQTVSLLMQDKEYFSKMTTELQSKLSFTEDKLHQTEMQVDRMKQAREELYEKYINARDQYRNEYDDKLKQELEQMRVQMDEDISRLKTNTKDISEREIRSLREARDMALNEKNLALMSQKEAMNKYEQLLLESRQRQLSESTRIDEMQSVLKTKSFELERMHMLHEEAHNSYKISQQSYEKLQKKMDILTREYYNMQMTFERKTNDLENQLKEKVKMLQTYEQLEDEVDQLVLQAAELTNDEESTKLVSKFSQSVRLPLTTERRIIQCVSLAKKVIELEKLNTQLRSLLEKETARANQLSHELSHLEILKHDVQQPHSFLMQKVQERDQQINHLKDEVASANKTIENLQKEISVLKLTKEQMASDLEKLLSQEEELAKMKSLISDLTKKSTENIRSTSKQSQSKSALRIHFDEPEKDKTSFKHYQDKENYKLNDVKKSQR